MLAQYGPQHWWPGDTGFEIMAGAVLTQAASWTNVEKAIANLKAAGALSPRAIRELPEDRLALLVFPSGYYNAKARKLKALAGYLGRSYRDDLDAMAQQDTDLLRSELIGVHGIGEETADDILLYALGKPTFVVDSYTKRVFSRLGMAAAKGPYATYRHIFASNLPADATLLGEYHALIVRHARDICKREPVCRRCCLLDICPTGQERLPAAYRRLRTKKPPDLDPARRAP
jgi:endonuclease-3 related protein